MACIGCQRHVMGGGACARSLFKRRGSAHSLNANTVYGTLPTNFETFFHIKIFSVKIFSILFLSNVRLLKSMGKYIRSSFMVFGTILAKNNAFFAKKNFPWKLFSIHFWQTSDYWRLRTMHSQLSYGLRHYTDEK